MEYKYIKKFQEADANIENGQGEEQPKDTTKSSGKSPNSNSRSNLDDEFNKELYNRMTKNLLGSSATKDKAYTDINGTNSEKILWFHAIDKNAELNMGKAAELKKAIEGKTWSIPTKDRAINPRYKLVIRDTYLDTKNGKIGFLIGKQSVKNIQGGAGLVAKTAALGLAGATLGGLAGAQGKI